MNPAGLAERAERIAAARRPGVCDRDELVAALNAVEQIKAWASAQHAGLVNQLASVESFPEQTIADAERCDLGKATKSKERADTLADTPTLAGALEDGAITAGHVDAVTRGKKKLDGAEQQQEFIDRVEDLVDVAVAGTVEEYQRRLNLEIKKIQRSDGEDKLTRQRKQTCLSHWIDDDGMWNLRGRFDPVTGMKLAGKLDRAVQQLFAKATPEHCPGDPVEKNKFLAAHALVHLIRHSGTTADSGPDTGPEFAFEPGTDDEPTSGSDGLPEFDTSGFAGWGRFECVVVLDVDANPGVGPDVRFPIPIDVPQRVLAELVADATVETVIVRNGVVLHAPGNLDLGRSTRLANRAQRRALRAVYPCCAVPGCAVRYDRCRIHHIIWWRNGGRTDLDNLLPVCSKHHSLIHNDDWVIRLGPNRELTITLPDGRIMTTGPPNRTAA